jgi:hypothetical protein
MKLTFELLRQGSTSWLTRLQSLHYLREPGSFVSQRRQRIYFRRAARRQVTRQQRSDREQRSSETKRKRISRAQAKEQTLEQPPYFRDYQDMVLACYRVFSEGAVWSSPVADKGVVYFGSTDGFLYALQ